MSTSDEPGGAGSRPLPHQFPRRILLAVLGLAPQLLTETLYALAVRPDRGAPPFVPTDIHVVTTARGCDRAQRALLDPETGRFHRLCADYALDPRAISFDESSFLVVERRGRPLQDIVDAADHSAAATTILGFVRRLATDDGAAIHASLAGGRRTMGFYLGWALSLYGRPQDRLSHVLVDPRFAGADAFYYPPAAPATVVIRGRRLNTADARLALADVPFPRLRDVMPLPIVDRLPPHGELGAHHRPPAPPPAIEVRSHPHRLIAEGKTVTMPPADFAFYAMMARRRAAGRDFVSWRTPDLAAEYLNEYARVTADDWAPNTARVRQRLRNGADAEWFEQRKARVNHAIRAALGIWLAPAYEIASRGRRSDTSFGIRVDPARITLHD